MRPYARTLDAVKAVEEAGDFVSSDTDSGVAHHELHPALHLAQRDFDLTLEREFERVGDEIEDDFLPHLAIDIDGFREMRTVDEQLHLSSLDRRSEETRQIDRQRREFDGFIGAFDAAGL